MRRWLPVFAIFVACAVGAHLAVLRFAPELIMARAMSKIAERGIPLHAFTLSPRISPQTQTVVRPSPDIAYSICPYNFGTGIKALRVHIAGWQDYGSLAFFDSDTNNFSTVRDAGQGASVTLLPPGSAAAAGALVSPSRRGVILIRRLAPTATSYTAVAALAPLDKCEAVPR